MVKKALVFAAMLALLAACGAPRAQPTLAPAVASTATSGVAPSPNGSLTAEEAATLASLELVDDYPLYVMHYSGAYEAHAASSLPPAAAGFQAASTCRAQWGCSLFAALRDPQNRLFGRNFDWQFSPALLLFTDPQDGYASVSVVDIAYLGFEGDGSRRLTDLSLEQRHALLQAPYLPFDGMNERGLVVGMAAVPPGNMQPDPQKSTIGELRAIREILDHAATVDEAVQILGGHNIDMGSVPIHYLIASASGESALVEFVEGKMIVTRGDGEWQAATNFLVAPTNGRPQGQCWRYDRISQRLDELQGRISAPDALDLLSVVSQDNTQWSVVYHMTGGDIDIVMGRGYSEVAHSFHLERSAP